MFFDATIFGGSFDPVQEGHLQVANKLFSEAQTRDNGLAVIAPTARNPWKTARTLTPLSLRLEQWRLVLTDAGLPWSNSPQAGAIYLCDYCYEFSADFIRWWRASFSGPHRWTISSDSAGSEARWKDWAALQVPMQVMPIDISIHATDVREGRHPPLPALREFIQTHGLYPEARW